MSVPPDCLQDTLICQSAACSRQGTARSENQDTVQMNDQSGLFTIADGVGGSRGGAVASAMACCELMRSLDAQGSCRDDASHSTVVCGIRKAFRDAERSIQLEQKHSSGLRHMASTALLACIDRSACRYPSGEGRLYVANAGDSRVVLIRNHTAAQLTHEHRVAQGLCDAGLITAAEASRHPYHKTLYKHLGGCLDGGPELTFVPVRAGDTIILMTDGLWGHCENQQLVRMCDDEDSPHVIASRLICAAAENGSRDDASCIVIQLRESGERRAARNQQSAQSQQTTVPSPARLFCDAH